MTTRQSFASLRVTGLLLGAFALTASASAQSESSPAPVDNPTGDFGFYLRATPGVSLVQDTELWRFYGIYNGDIRFDAGTSIGLALGLQATSWLSVELNTGFSYNGIDRVGNASLYGSIDGSFMQIPVMANALIHYPIGDFLPYIGAGAGGTATLLHLDANGYWPSEYTTAFGVSQVDGLGGDFVLSYQLIAGGVYQITELIGLGVHYSFRGVDATRYDEFSNSAGTIGFNPVYTHTISLDFRLKF